MAAIDHLQDAIQRLKAEASNGKKISTGDLDDLGRDHTNHTQSDHHTDPLEQEALSSP